jgi:hypothetical protein
MAENNLEKLLLNARLKAVRPIITSNEVGRIGKLVMEGKRESHDWQLLLQSLR